MKFRLERRTYTSKSTTGRLYAVNPDTLEAVHLCFTLEDTDRGVDKDCTKKVAGKTCVPEGTYVLLMDHSTRFDRILPHVMDVPCFEGIRIHAGNTDADTEGCICVGKTIDADFVGMSRDALAYLLPIFEKNCPTSITIERYGG